MRVAMTKLTITLDPVKCQVYKQKAGHMNLCQAARPVRVRTTELLYVTRN